VQISQIIIIIMPPTRRRILPASDCTPPISPESSSLTTPMERNTSVVVSPTQRTTRASRRASSARSSSKEREFIRLQDAEKHMKHKETLLKDQLKYKRAGSLEPFERREGLQRAGILPAEDRQRDRSRSVTPLRISRASSVESNLSDIAEEEDHRDDEYLLPLRRNSPLPGSPIANRTRNR
jgi:hypothetical protein